MSSLLNPEPQNRRRLFWLMQAFGWTVMSALPFMLLHQAGVPFGSAAIMGVCRGISGLILSSLLLRPVLGYLWQKDRRLKPKWAVLIALHCLLLGWIDGWLMVPFISQFDVDFSAVPLSVVKASWLFRGSSYVIWTVLYCVVHHWADTQDTRLRLSQLQAERRTMELQQLRAQMNPHFLFNAFNSILAEAENPKAVTTLTEGVAEYLRFSLRQTDALQQLGEELDALEHYLRVEKVRFEERFDYRIVASDAARQRQVPGALVQPLVENAIKYGPRTSPPPLRLSISAEVTASGDLVISVANTGRWIASQATHVASDRGIGLANVGRRLQLLYGAAARCECTEADGWVNVRLQLPEEART